MQSVNGERGTLCGKPVDEHLLLTIWSVTLSLKNEILFYVLSIAYQGNAVKIEIANFRN